MGMGARGVGSGRAGGHGVERPGSRLDRDGIMINVSSWLVIACGWTPSGVLF